MVGAEGDLLGLKDLVALAWCGIEEVVDIQKTVVALPLVGHFNCQVVRNRLTVVSHFSFLVVALLSLSLGVDVSSEAKLGGAPEPDLAVVIDSARVGGVASYLL